MRSPRLARFVPKRDRQETSVSFVQGREDKASPVKVGMSTNVRKRIIAPRDGNPYTLEALAVLEPCYPIHEKVWHRILNPWRTRPAAEWFRLPPAIVEAIPSLNGRSRCWIDLRHELDALAASVESVPIEEREATIIDFMLRTPEWFRFYEEERRGRGPRLAKRSG